MRNNRCKTMKANTTNPSLIKAFSSTFSVVMQALPEQGKNVNVADIMLFLVKKTGQINEMVARQKPERFCVTIRKCESFFIPKPSRQSKRSLCYTLKVTTWFYAEECVLCKEKRTEEQTSHVRYKQYCTWSNNIWSD